ncbi:MAG TPA: CBS domain-containing protein, partial [Pseudogracilibacillus sp.]|nr:CBS domain-containing protein [Pseudogracilibacillus sp.]
LDPLIRREMQLELIRLQKKLKKTIVFITHDVNEAFKLGDRIAVMKDGRVVQIGTPEEIIENPVNDYIVDFVQDIDRSKVFQAEHIMIEPRVTVSINDTAKKAVRLMREHSISSLFAVDDKERVVGIITIDDAVKSIKREESVSDFIRTNIELVREDDYVNDLIPKFLDTKYPLAVVNNRKQLLGIILRVHVLSGLVSEDLNGNNDS